MSIFYMHSKTFLKMYRNENPKSVLDTNYILISSDIQKGGKYEDSVINANAILYPSQTTLMLEDNYKSESYINMYKEQLNSTACEKIFAVAIKKAIEDSATIVFLCSHREYKMNYLKLIQEYVMERFNYPIYNYKKYKKGKEKAKKFNKSEVIETCDRVIKNANRETTQKLLQTKRGRDVLIKNMTKKQIKILLKKEGYEPKRLSKKEQREIIRDVLE